MTKTKNLEDILLTFFEEAVEYGSNSAKVFDKAIKAINHLNDLKWKKRVEEWVKKTAITARITPKDRYVVNAKELLNLLTKAGV